MKKYLKQMTGFLIAGLAFAGCSGLSGNNLNVEKEKTYELGEAVTILPKDFVEADVDTSELENMKIESDLLTSPAYEYNGFKGEVKTAGKDYLEKGEYDLTLVDGNSTYPIRLIVNDTTAPNFIMAPARRVVASGSSEQDVLRAYKAEDKDEAALALEGDYDLNEPGDYTVKVTATDPSGNKSEMEISLKVTGDGEMITSDDTADLSPDDYASQNETQDNGEQTETQTPESEESSEDIPSSNEPSVDQTPEDQTPEDQTPETPACSVSHAPAGATIYYSFDEAYAAGIAWNQQDPNNYFFYLQGTDDCGTPVYLITTGTKTGDDGI